MSTVFPESKHLLFYFRYASISGDASGGGHEVRIAPDVDVDDEI